MKKEDQSLEEQLNENSRVAYCPHTPIGPDGMICNECEHLPYCVKNYMSYYVKLPHFIIDHYMSKSEMSHTAFVLLVYLCRRVNFDDRSNHYGRCWQTLKKISEATGIGINNMRKYLNELQSKGLITWTYKRIKDKNGTMTTHEFHVLHYKYVKDAMQVGYRQLSQIKQKKEN
jgi:hypothetical protein